jgi:hypothetical protein
MSTDADMSVYATDHLNLDLLVEVRDHIAAHPLLHDQSHYEFTQECGTSRCVAGWATHLMGLTSREVHLTEGSYDVVASAALGISTWQSQRDDASLASSNNHPFNYRHSHEETLRNLDSLISLAKDQEDKR